MLPITLTTLFVSTAFGSGDEKVIGLFQMVVGPLSEIVILASHFMASL